MKNRGSRLTIAVLIIALLSIGANAQTHSTASTDSMAIFPRGRPVPAANFTGKAWVYDLIQVDSAFNIPVANVTFEPGARTYWHSHAGGQVLLAMGGIGYYQEKGKPIQILQKGDVVKCPSNVPHWHGASPTTGFTQVAITPNTPKGRTTWLQNVTDDEYNSLKK